MKGQWKIRITNCLILLECFLEDQLGGNKPNYFFITYKMPKKPEPRLALGCELVGGEASLFLTCTINYRALVKKN